MSWLPSAVRAPVRMAILILLLAGNAFAQDLTEKGKKVFQQAGCVACHKIQGQGGPTGPDLTHIGAIRTDQTWYWKFLRDPASVNPASRMVSFGDLSEEEMKALIAYLLTLR